MTVKFSVYGIPTAKGRPRFSVRGGYARAYTPAKTRKAEEGFAKEAQIACLSPLKGPLQVTIRFIMPIPKSLIKKIKNGDRHIKRPDLDNLAKVPMDAMNGICWDDDSQVAALLVTKRYGTEPRTEVEVEPAY